MPRTLLKHQIPVRTWADWDDATQPGFFEIGDADRGPFELLGHDVASVAIHQHIVRSIFRGLDRQGLMELAMDFRVLAECLVGRAFREEARDVNGG